MLHAAYATNARAHMPPGLTPAGQGLAGPGVQVMLHIMHLPTSICPDCLHLAGGRVLWHHNVCRHTLELGGKGYRCGMVARAAQCGMMYGVGGVVLYDGRG
jgi:hypothetical protein